MSHSLKGIAFVQFTVYEVSVALVRNACPVQKGMPSVGVRIYEIFLCFRGNCSCYILKVIPRVWFTVFIYEVVIITYVLKGK